MNKFLLVLLLIATPVLSGQVDVRWVAPNEREDGSELVQSDIGGYRIYNEESTLIKDTFDNLVTNSIIDLPNGSTYKLTVTTYDVDGRESIHSQFVSVALDHSVPKPPTGVTATVL